MNEIITIAITTASLLVALVIWHRLKGQKGDEDQASKAPDLSYFYGT